MAQTAGHAVPVTVTDKGGKAAIALPSDTTKTDSIDRDMTLGELVVKADRVRRRPGGYTVNLTGSGLAKGKDMNRMLASLPGLAIENGSLTLQGQAPAAVYIDGVKASDMEMLKNLPPESVASVSVDWHAGREETAGTRGGVIRIKTKKVSGTAGTLSLTAEYSPGYGYTGETPTAYLSVGTRRMTITNNAAFAHQAPQGEYTEDRTMKATGAHTMTTSDSHGWTRNLYDRLNISYDIAPRHSLGLMGYIAYADMKRHSNAESTGSDGATSLLRYNLPSHSLMAQAVAMYNWDIDDKCSSLNITADYLSRSAADKITTHTTDASGTRQATTSARQASDMLRIRPIWKKSDAQQR